VSYNVFSAFSPPLSLTWVAAIAEQHGHEATIIDARTLKLSPAAVVDRLREFRPDLIGFMMTTYMFRKRWSGCFYQNQLRVPVILGG
jgi:hypothetical protein